MLIGFTIKNFKSFYKENTLSLISSSKIRKHKEHLLANKRFKILKYSFFLGPNGGGKTNLIKAFAFYRSFIVFNKVTYNDFAFKNKDDEETSFKLTFLTNNTIYTYGFGLKKGKTLLDGIVLTSESLSKSTLYGEETQIYNLENNSIEFNNKKIVINENLKVYLDNFNASNKQETFLSYLNDYSRKNNLGESAKDINIVFNYILKNIVLITNNDFNYQYIENINLDEISNKLKKYDTGIDSIKLLPINNDDIIRDIPSELLAAIKTNFLNEDLKNTILESKETLYYFSKNEDNSIEIKELIFRHNNIDSNFTFNEESEGTLRLLFLFSFLSSKKQDVTLLIDEFDKGLHPLVSIEVLKDFIRENEYTTSDPNTNQLLCSSHLTMLLSRDLLRNDEIYFIDKDNHGGSSIYSLSEYKTRSDTNIEKDYYDGRYSAIPKFK